MMAMVCLNIKEVIFETIGAPVLQWIEELPSKQSGVSSILTGCTINLYERNNYEYYKL